MARRLARQRQVMGSVTRSEKCFEMHRKKSINVATEGTRQLKRENVGKRSRIWAQNYEERKRLPRRVVAIKILWGLFAVDGG